MSNSSKSLIGAVICGLLYSLITNHWPNKWDLKEFFLLVIIEILLHILLELNNIKKRDDK